MLHPTTHFHHVLQNVAARSLVGLDVNNPNCHQEVAVRVCVGEKGEGGKNKENVQCIYLPYSETERDNVSF